MRKFGARRTCALLFGLSQAFGSFGRAVAEKSGGVIQGEVKRDEIGKNVNVGKVKKSNKGTFYERGRRWVRYHKEESFLLGGLMVDSAWRAVNEVRLKNIYKAIEGSYENGGCSSSVKKYVYYDDKDAKNLVIKSINRLVPLDYISFWNEQFACKVIPGLAQKNSHLANIIDYHYGLTHNYVVYEDVGANYDWASEMTDWEDNKKLLWLEDVIAQMADVILFLYDEGYCHNDFKLDNLSILKKDDKPFVRIFDYGLFAKRESIISTTDLSRLLGESIRLCCQVLFGEKHVRAYGVINLVYNQVFNRKEMKEIKETQESNVDKLFKNYKESRLVKAIGDFYSDLKYSGVLSNWFMSPELFAHILKNFRARIN